MQRLKKFGAIGGAIVLAACWPLAVGQIAQSVLNNGMTSLQSGDFSTEVISYDRRYMSATAATKITVNNPGLKQHLESSGLPTVFLVQHNIKHGLLQVTAQSRLVDLDVVPAVLHTQTRLNGNTEFELLVDNINYQVPGLDKASAYLAKSRVSGEATVLGEVSFSFSLPSVQLRFETDDTITLSSLNGLVKGKNATGLWHGEQQFQLDNVELMSAQRSVAVQDFSYQLSSLIDDSGERLNSNLMIQAASITATDMTELKDLHLDMTFGNLDVDSFGGLLKAYQTTPVFDKAALAQSAAMVDQLFSKGFQVSLNQLKLTQGEGEFHSDWVLEVPQGTDNVTQNASQIVTALTGKLDSYASKKLLNMYPYIQQDIDKLVSMELVQPTDAGYSMNTSLSNGVLTFAGGKKMPLMTFLMLNATEK